MRRADRHGGLAGRRRGSRARHPLAPTISASSQEGEILVTPVTAPSWAPIFGKISATVTDIGGMMSPRRDRLPRIRPARRDRHGSAPSAIKTGQSCASTARRAKSRSCPDRSWYGNRTPPRRLPVMELGSSCRFQGDRQGRYDAVWRAPTTCARARTTCISRSLSPIAQELLEHLSRGRPRHRLARDPAARHRLVIDRHGRHHREGLRPQHDAVRRALPARNRGRADGARDARHEPAGPKRRSQQVGGDHRRPRHAPARRARSTTGSCATPTSSGASPSTGICRRLRLVQDDARANMLTGRKGPACSRPRGRRREVAPRIRAAPNARCASAQDATSSWLQLDLTPTSVHAMDMFIDGAVRPRPRVRARRWTSVNPATGSSDRHGCRTATPPTPTARCAPPTRAFADWRARRSRTRAPAARGRRTLMRVTRGTNSARC